jgi:hypothetical protein
MNQLLTTKMPGSRVIPAPIGQELCLPPSQIPLTGQHPSPREKRRRREAGGP